MNKFFHLLVIFLSVVFLVGTFLGASFVWDAFLRSPSPTASEVTLVVTSGESVGEISHSLKRAGLIPSRLGFQFYVKLTRVEHRFQPGEFILTTGMNYASLVAALVTFSSDEVAITFPEGLTNEQMAARIDSTFGQGWGEEWLASLPDKTLRTTYSFLPQESLEGYLFPDTYRVSRSGFPEDLTYKLLTNFGEKLSSELRAEISRQGRTIHEAIVLASIVEKEVAADTDRAMVADIFWRRLEVGLALQADSTVHFIVGNDGGSAYTSDAERAVDSLYNTYKYRGLPPGPICNPGLSAIEAVIYPAENNYWYFLTDPEGGVHYATTNDGQNENKARYLR
jgi:UPF0755 protein